MLTKQDTAVYDNHAIIFANSVIQHLKSTLHSSFSCSIKLDWSPRRVSSRGGLYSAGPGISMAMLTLHTHYRSHNPMYYEYKEYPSFNEDKIIGGFLYNNTFHKAEALLLHEIAHAAQFFHYKFYNTRCTPHGHIFKQYYAELRTQFLNARLLNV